MTATRHITLPAGFIAAGVKCGIKESGKEDLAIIAAERRAAAALLTTRNQVVGAPVLWCRRALPRGYGRVRGIVINSGNSNACTGPAGLRDAEDVARRTASCLGATAEEVLVASTGVIGHRLPMAKIHRGIAAAAAALGRNNDVAVLRSIMTTDLREKSAVVRGRIGGVPFTMAGIVKGSGMIAPSLATMIAVVTTDLAVSPAAMHSALVRAARTTFNAVTVDSDTSTSDTVVVLAGGAAGNVPVARRSKAFTGLCEALEQVCGELARAVVADGEGATKVIRVTVRGARNDAEAEAAAKSVANSPLVKCAVHGGDPNWGRIVMALGKSAAKVEPEKLSVRIGGATVFARGVGGTFDLKKVETHMAGNSVEIECNLGLGRAAFTAWTCDLSKEYVTINADYRT